MEHRIAGRLEYYEGFKYHSIPYTVDGCNGFLLLEQYDQVVNPATRQWACLPPYPASPRSGYYSKYLAFDPTLSPPHYYEVLAMQYPFRFRDKLAIAIYDGMYSSSMTKWEGRPFAREEGSATTIAHFGSRH
jgi:hypothetical protein